jgi:hypothetical protein
MSVGFAPMNLALRITAAGRVLPDAFDPAIHRRVSTHYGPSREAAFGKAKPGTSAESILNSVIKEFGESRSRPNMRSTVG